LEIDLGNASNAFTISAANAGRDSNTDSGFTYVRMVNNIARVLHHPTLIFPTYSMTTTCSSNPDFEL
jgi:hypothetical protein